MSKARSNLSFEENLSPRLNETSLSFFKTYSSPKGPYQVNFEIDNKNTYFAFKLSIPVEPVIELAMLELEVREITQGKKALCIGALNVDEAYQNVKLDILLLHQVCHYAVQTKTDILFENISQPEKEFFSHYFKKYHKLEIEIQQMYFKILFEQLQVRCVLQEGDVTKEVNKHCLIVGDIFMRERQKTQPKDEEGLQILLGGECTVPLPNCVNLVNPFRL